MGNQWGPQRRAGRDGRPKLLQGINEAGGQSNHMMYYNVDPGVVYTFDCYIKRPYFYSNVILLSLGWLKRHPSISKKKWFLGLHSFEQVS